jgi:hypothetical protein
MKARLVRRCRLRDTGPMPNGRNGINGERRSFASRAVALAALNEPLLGRDCVEQGIPDKL